MKMGKDFVGVGVGVLILNKDNKALLLKRKNINGSGNWCLPGGKIELNERVTNCAKREVKEETCLDVKIGELISVSNDIMYGTHYVTLGFKAKILKGEPRNMEPDKCEEIGWFPLDKLPKPLFIATERVIRNYLNKNIFLDEK